jgi:hypothetical protein
MQQNNSVEIAKLQVHIDKYLNLGATTTLFEYSEVSEGVRLDLVTVNPRHNQSFLFHTTVGRDKVEALQKMSDYVQNTYEKRNSYTIQWSVVGENELHTSYFRAKDIPEALDKLYYGRDANALNIFSVVLNPIS